MGEIFDWDPTDDDNTSPWPEGMTGSQINNAGRAMQGALARHYLDTDGSRVAAGSSNAFAVTSARTITDLFDNLRQTFTANHNITGAATLDLNGLGAKSIKRFNGSNLAAGDIVADQVVDVVFKDALDCWLVTSVLAASTGNMYADFDENAAPGDPAADGARLYAKDVNGTTRLAYRDSAGTETLIGYQGELVAIIEDRKTQNTAGQSLTAGVDNVRELNTLAFNRDTLVSLSSNRFTLPAGTWEISWEAPVYAASTNITNHQSFLYNQSDSSVVARGSTGYAYGESGDTVNIVQGSPVSTGSAVVTIASSKAFEIRHRVAANGTGGRAANFGTEVYTRVVVRRA